MSILARLFGAVPKKERGGIHLREDQPWRIGPTTDFERFLRSLALLAPEGAIVYFEGTSESHVTEFLRRVAVPAPVRVAVGTIWPRPDAYHVPLTADGMEEFAAFLERRPAGYLCSHCHVHRDGSILLEWHDAFTTDPMYVSRTISEDAVGRFARALGSTYASGWAG